MQSGIYNKAHIRTTDNSHPYMGLLFHHAAWRLCFNTRQGEYDGSRWIGRIYVQFCVKKHGLSCPWAAKKGNKYDSNTLAPTRLMHQINVDFQPSPQRLRMSLQERIRSRYVLIQPLTSSHCQSTRFQHYHNSTRLTHLQLAYQKARLEYLILTLFCPKWEWKF